jgi:hypothetical protein
MSVGSMAVPQDFSVQSSGDRLAISWKAPGHWLLAVAGLFALVCSSCLLACFTVGGGEFRWGCVVAAVGIVLSAYLALAGLLDRMVVTVSRSGLEAAHGPLPVPLGRLFPVRRRVRIDPACLERVYVRETQLAGTEREGGDYDVHAQVADAGDTILLSRLSAEEALYLEQQIEQFLGIEDRSVKGEWAGKATGR